MKTIRETIESTLGFHGRTPDAVTASIVDALEVREAQIQADLLKFAVDKGMYEDDAIDAIQEIFVQKNDDTAEPTFDSVLAQIVSTSRLLSQQTSALADLH